MDEIRLEQLVQRLTDWGLDGLALGLTENAGPLTVFGAQALYLAAPTLSALTPLGSVAEVNNWAAWLEDPASLSKLAQQLERAQHRRRTPTP